MILLDRYKILTKLSQGGFGKVYLCKYIHSNKEFIAKVNSDTIMNDSEYAVAQKMSGTKGFPQTYEKGSIED